MALHRLSSVVVGVPDLAANSAYYAQFGLTAEQDGWFSTVDGGRQLQLVR